jgi:heterodisulfide reductase subunit C
MSVGGALLDEHSVVWQCFTCERCRAHCPSDVKPVDVIRELRGMLVDRVFHRDR